MADLVRLRKLPVKRTSILNALTERFRKLCCKSLVVWSRKPRQVRMSPWDINCFERVRFWGWGFYSRKSVVICRVSRVSSWTALFIMNNTVLSVFLLLYFIYKYIYIYVCVCLPFFLGDMCSPNYKCVITKLYTNPA